LEQKRELNAEMQPAQEIRKTKEIPISEYLTTGDKIEYNNTVFKVQGHLKQGRLRMEDLGTGNSFILSRNDNLYGSLLRTKQNSNREIDIAQHEVAPTHQQTENTAPHVTRR